jgi:hypothetical protein
MGNSSPSSSDNLSSCWEARLGELPPPTKKKKTTSDDDIRYLSVATQRAPAAPASNDNNVSLLSPMKQGNAPANLPVVLANVTPPEKKTTTSDTQPPTTDKLTTTSDNDISFPSVATQKAPAPAPASDNDDISLFFNSKTKTPVTLPPMLANAKLNDVVLKWAANKDGLLLTYHGNNLKTAELILGVDISKLKVDPLSMLCSFWGLKNIGKQIGWTLDC